MLWYGCKTGVAKTSHMKKNGRYYGQIHCYCNCSTRCGSNRLTPLFTTPNPGQSRTGYGPSVCSEWRGFQRCTSLIWNARLHEATTNQMFVGLLPKSLPSLKHISFTDFIDPIGGSQFPNCPVLERVEMLRHYMPSPHFWGTNFLHVTALSFGNYNFWVDFDLTTLSLFPVLRDLTLFTVHSVTGLSGADIQSPVIFENLHILRARGRIPPEVLINLVAPALEELHIKANDINLTSIDVLETSFNPPCQYIHALLPVAVCAKEPEWATKLSKFVQKCTKVKSIYISRWMQEGCKKYMGGQDVALHVQ